MSTISLSQTRRRSGRAYIFILILVLARCNLSSLALIPFSGGSDGLSFSFGISDHSAHGSVFDRSIAEFDDCLHGRSGFYRRYEPGLQIKYCPTTADESFSKFLSNIKDSQLTNPTAYDRYSDHGIKASVLSPANLRDTIGQARLLYCEPDCNKGLQYIASDTTIVSKPFYQPDERNLPRRFYQNEMSVAISDRIWLLYRITTTRILAISFGSDKQADELYQFLQSDTQQIVDVLFADHQTDSLFISGSYSGDTGGAGNEQLILSSADKPVIQNLVIAGSNVQTMLFDHSSVVLRRDDPLGFKFQTIPELEWQSGSLTESQYTPSIAVPDRVALRKSASSDFSATGLCLWTNPCSIHDIPIDIAKEIEAEILSTNNLKLCTADDVSITEINPFGIITTSGSAINTGGKFIELAAKQRCANRSMAIRQSDIVISLPFEIEKGAFVVAADQSLFDTSVTEQSSLRRLKPASVELIFGNDNSATPEIITTNIDSGTYWIYGSRNNALGLRRVHSLQVFADDDSQEVKQVQFHPNHCSGLRQDLCITHAMTPGRHESANESAIVTPQISEVLPFLNNRFIEVYCSDCSGQTGQIQLQIERQSDGRLDRYTMPVPDHSIVVVSPTEACGYESSKFADLYLPSSAATYTIGFVTAAGQQFHQTDQWIITTAMYNTMRQQKRSLSLTASGIGLTQTQTNGCDVAANPGLIEWEH